MAPRRRSSPLLPELAAIVAIDPEIGDTFTMKPLSAVGCVVVALAVGTVFGRWTAGLETAAAPVRANPKAGAPPSMGFLPSRAAAGDEPTTSVNGVVREIIQVPSYTYLRLEHDGAEVWAAVSTSTALTAGAQVTIADAAVMHDFASKTLGRTFGEIYFGRLL